MRPGEKRGILGAKEGRDMKPFHQWTREERERYYAALQAHINNPEYFSSHIGVKVTRIADGEADGELFADETNCNS